MPHIDPALELEALKQAVRWPNPSLPAIVTLVGQFLAAHRDRDADAYFAERAREHTDQPLFLALEGLFQARMAGSLPFFRRPAWVRDALRKLDSAVESALGLTTYFRGVVQADLPVCFAVGRWPSATWSGCWRTRTSSRLACGAACTSVWLIRQPSLGPCHLLGEIGRQPGHRAEAAWC